MKTMLFVVTAIALLFVVPDEALAWDYGCSPEYSECVAPGDPNSGQVSGGVRDGTKSYGEHYVKCEAGGKSFDGSTCWECTFDPEKKTDRCGGAYHSANCECTETYRNWVITGCSIYGTCTYLYL